MHIENMFIQEPKAVNGIFIGSPLCFSDTILKIADGEVNCVQFTRLDTLSDLAKLKGAASEEQRTSVRNILIDECMLAEFCAAFLDFQTAFPSAQFALAFRKPLNAHRLMELANERPELRQISLLPMTLEVDRWLSVLRLLICGEHYVPSELMVPRQPDPQPPVIQSSPALKRDDPQSQQSDSAILDECDQVRLTDRELQVLRSAAEGKPNKIIAEELRLSQHTIKLHMHHLMAKLGVHNRTEAAIWFFDHQHQVARPQT